MTGKTAKQIQKNTVLTLEAREVFRAISRKAKKAIKAIQEFEAAVDQVNEIK